jgi:hypothetical protein
MRSIARSVLAPTKNTAWRLLSLLRFRRSAWPRADAPPGPASLFQPLTWRYPRTGVICRTRQAAAQKPSRKALERSIIAWRCRRAAMFFIYPPRPSPKQGRSYEEAHDHFGRHRARARHDGSGADCERANAGRGHDPRPSAERHANTRSRVRRLGPLVPAGKPPRLRPDALLVRPLLIPPQIFSATVPRGRPSGGLRFCMQPSLPRTDGACSCCGL